MKLRIERLEAPGEMDGQGLPVVHFTGTARSMHQAHDPNANSRLRGEFPITTPNSILSPQSPQNKEIKLTPFSMSQRHSSPHTLKRRPLDNNLPLRRRRTLALRVHTNRWITLRPWCYRDLVS
jgi:hypothetical protein